jgi:hypothetical protein|tara:strand:+ start:3131 stop:3784 length:654 start_codon:yes stop_codon:yes gene_type:complete
VKEVEVNNKMTKESDLFLRALVKITREEHVKSMIEREIQKRLSSYPFLKDLQSRRLDCVSQWSELNGFQFQSPLGLRAKEKLKKWEQYGDAYLFRYWRNATISYCRRILKGGMKIAEDTNTNVNDESEINRVNQLTKKREKLESYLDLKVHSENKIQCFLDRLDGMTFSAMIQKYEPENFYKDKKGQKYIRRFARFVNDELDIKDEVKEYFDLLKQK